MDVLVFLVTNYVRKVLFMMSNHSDECGVTLPEPGKDMEKRPANCHLHITKLQLVKDITLPIKRNLVFL